MFKKICVVTGSRCEYGLLYWLMKEMQADPSITLQIIATGMHLSHEFGLTYKKILEDGFHIDQKVEMLLSSDSAVGIAKSIGLGVIGFADAYQQLEPDLVVLLGDRFESLAAAQSAFIAKIPIAHIHGGELTMGAYDDGIRHCITKMSHLHFVATQAYRERVIQLGEHPDFVYHVGACVLDSLNGLTYLSKSALEDLLKIKFNQRNVVVTYHPQTLSHQTSEQEISQVLAALVTLDNTNIIFTKGNSDSHGRIINDMIDEFCAKNATHAKAFMDLGHQNYLSLLKVVDMAIGNSSSGIIEAPYCQIPTINIGDRQKGRVRAASVIDCCCETNAIIKAIEKGFSDEHQQRTATMQLPYGKGNVAKQILSTIKNLNVAELIQKQFYDMKV